MNKKNMLLFSLLLLLTIGSFTVLFVKNDQGGIIEENNKELVVTKSNIMELYTNDEFKSLASLFIGKKIPEFRFKLNDETLEAEKGKNYLLIFGLTECPACTESVESVKTFVLENEDLNSYSFYFDKTTTELNEFITTNNLSPENVFGSDSFVGYIEDFRMKFAPTIFFVNKDGIVEYVHFGSINYEQLSSYYEIINQ